jgi:hypothetical protein
VGRWDFLSWNPNWLRGFCFGSTVEGLEGRGRGDPEQDAVPRRDAAVQDQGASPVEAVREALHGHPHPGRAGHDPHRRAEDHRRRAAQELHGPDRLQRRQHRPGNFPITYFPR